MVLVIWEGFEALEAPRKSSQNELIFRLTRKTDKPIVVWMSENHLKPLLHMRHHFLIYLNEATIIHELGFSDFHEMTMCILSFRESIWNPSLGGVIAVVQKVMNNPGRLRNF
jgi:hypothetical protein